MRARKPFWLWAWIMYTLVGTGILSACAPQIELAEPIIVLDPITGGPGTSVAVSGSGFPAEVQVSVRLGPPSVGATPQSYGDATTDADGRFVLAFAMPAQWPDGTAITETDLIVVVLNQDGSVKVSAPFEYASSASESSTPVLNRIGDDDRVILTWHREGGAAGSCEDGAVYWSGLVEVTACEGMRRAEYSRLSKDAIDRLHAWTETYQSFEFEQRSAATKDGVKVQVALVGTGTRHVSETERRAIQELLVTLILQ